MAAPSLRAHQRNGRISAGSLIWALRRVWELPPELCKLTALFWESPHSQNYRRRVMMELEALCVRVALMASCSLSKAAKTEHSEPFRYQPRVWTTPFDVPSQQVLVCALPSADVVAALDARVRQLPCLWRYTAPACHPDSNTREGKCKTCGSTDKASLLDDWAKFPEAYPNARCAGHLFACDSISQHYPIELVFPRVWQLCHAAGTGTSAEQIAEESGTIEDALRRLGCSLTIDFGCNNRGNDDGSTQPVTVSVTITETIRSTKTFKQTGVECLRDVVRNPKRTSGAPAAASAKVRRVG